MVVKLSPENAPVAVVLDDDVGTARACELAEADRHHDLGARDGIERAVDLRDTDAACRRRRGAVDEAGAGCFQVTPNLELTGERATRVDADRAADEPAVVPAGVGVDHQFADADTERAGC